MNRRSFLAAAAASPLAAAELPNLVILLADDLGSADLSSYGAPDIRTPNIDSIGRQGVRFTQAYCNAPECTPSRAALLTGRYQQRVGGLECAIGLANVGRYDHAIWLQKRGALGLPTSEVTMARLLKDAGYDTACIGKWHLGYLPAFSPNAHGFDEYFGILGGSADYWKHVEDDGANVLYHNGKPVKREGYLTDLLGAAAVDWLAKRSRKPFFLYLPFNAPHNPYQSYKVRDIPPGAYNAGGAGKETREIYVDMVQAVDKQVGAVLAQLEKMNAARNTWVVFMSDNGGVGVGSNGALRGKKSSLWEGGIRMPCLMRWPGMIPAGTETTQVSLMMDITASMLAAAGVRSPRPLDGENLLPVWQGKAPVKPRTVFWRYRRGDNTRKAVRQGDWKLVNDNGREELHNLGSDPNEANNVLSANTAVAAGLRSRIAKWEEDVRAPRLADFR